MKSQPAPESSMTGIACGPGAIITITTRRCRPCGRTGEHATQYQGVYFGEDHVCLGCGAAWIEGDPTVLSPDRARHWEEMVARDLIPADLYDRYVAADRALHAARNGIAEALASRRYEDVWADIAAHRSAQNRTTGGLA